MYSWLADVMVRRSIRQMNAGDLRGLLRGFADDAVLIFPGEHSWAGTYRGKREIERFFRRAVDTGLRFSVGDVVAKGPPWDMTVCFQLADRATDADGSVVYANRVMEHVKLSWGKIKRQEVYLDTQKVAAFDDSLGRAEPATAAGRPGQAGRLEAEQGEATSP